MAWCRQATSHYLSQCWPRSLSPYDGTGQQWVTRHSKHGIGHLIIHDKYKPCLKSNWVNALHNLVSLLFNIAVRIGDPDMISNMLMCVSVVHRLDANNRIVCHCNKTQYNNILNTVTQTGHGYCGIVKYTTQPVFAPSYGVYIVGI